MKPLLLATITLLTVCANAANPELVAKVISGELKEARASWWGFNGENATAELQAAISSQVPRLIIDNQGAPWITDRLTGVSNQEIIFESGVELLALKGAFTGKNDSLLTLAGVTNVILRGARATLRMRRSDYDAPPYVRAEWRHALSIRSCANIQVHGLTLAESGGDGIYLGSIRPDWPNNNILIHGVICDRNYRQGISVISAENLMIENTIMRNTAGTPPAAGIDFEPNHAGERLKNCVMRSCLTENNQGDGYEFYLPNLNAASEPISIWLENCRSIGDRTAFRFITGNSEQDAVRGNMTLENCHLEKAQHHGIIIGRKPEHGADLTLINCTISDCAPSTNTTPEIIFNMRSEDEFPVGGIRFNYLVIKRPMARPWAEFHGATEYEPLTALSGMVVLLQPNRAPQRIALTPTWLSENFPPRFQVRIPRVTMDLANARIVNKVEGVQKLTPLRMRHGGNYLFYAQAGQQVYFSGTQTRIGKNSASQKPLVIRMLGNQRELHRVAMPATFGTRAELNFTPAETGFYTLEVSVAGNAFMLHEANVPVAWDTTLKPINLIASTGTLYAVVPKGSKLFAFGVRGEGSAELVKATLRNPSGETVWSLDNIGAPERYTVDSTESAPGGMWQISFERPSNGVFEDFNVQALGIPAYLFLSKEMHWEF